MLKTIRKRKHNLFFFTTFLVAFSMLFGGLLVGGFVLADDGHQEPLEQRIQELQEETTPPDQTDPDDPDETTTSDPDEDDPDETTTSDPDENDNDDDGISDEDEEKLSREVKVDHNENQVTIESKLKVGERKDEFKVEIEEEGKGLQIKYEYESEADSLDLDSEIELKVRFVQILEYSDTAGDGFDEGDIIGEPYRLEDFTYTINSVGTSDTGEKLSEITAVDEGGVFIVRVFVPEQFTLLNGEQIAPTTLKIDIEIHNFPFTDTEGTSQLVLDTRVEVETSASVGFVEDDDGTIVGLDATIGNYTAEFTWVGTASIDGEPGTVDAIIYDSEVKIEESEEEVEVRVDLFYPRGEHIIHDPKMGTPLDTLDYAQEIRVSTPSPQPSVSEGPLGILLLNSLMVTLLVIAIPAISRRRTR